MNNIKDLVFLLWESQVDIITVQRKNKSLKFLRNSKQKDFFFFFLPPQWGSKSLETLLENLLLFNSWKLGPTLCYPMDYSRPGSSVHHYVQEFAQIHVHWVGDAIQTRHPQLTPSPFAFDLSQHQSLFQQVGSSYQKAKVLVLHLQHQSSNKYSGLISFRIDWFDLLQVQSTL